MVDQGVELTLEALHLRLQGLAWGAEEGLPVLALHGWLDNAATFSRLAPLLPGLRWVALDFAGHGGSAHRPAGSFYHFTDFVADAIYAADTLGWERFYLLGHSLGAAVASCLAAALPERVIKLVLIEGIGPLAGTADSNPGRLARSLQQLRDRGKRRAPLYPDPDTAIKARMRVGPLSEAAATPLVQRNLMQVAGGYSWRSDPRLMFASPLYLDEEQVGGFLRAIQAKTLLIRAEQGLLAERPQTILRCQAVADLQVVDLAGGHHLHLEDPEPTAAAIKAFLAQG